MERMPRGAIVDRIRVRHGDLRSLERIRHHYEVEKELAARLKHATRAQRPRLYGALYEELYRRVPDHPLLRKNASAAAMENSLNAQTGFLHRFISADSTFLEVGAGDCELSFRLSNKVTAVLAVDVTDKAIRRGDRPANFRLLLSSGCDIPLQDATVDVVFSNQLMEHLHPDDALEQLTHIARVLKSGGAYVCITPNRLYGPRDISEYFDAVASGFHLREYTIRELQPLLAAAGFAKTVVYAGARGWYLRCPAWLVTGTERLLEKLPCRWRKRLADLPPMRALLGIRLVATKA